MITDSYRVKLKNPELLRKLSAGLKLLQRNRLTLARVILGLISPSAGAGLNLGKERQSESFVDKIRSEIYSEIYSRNNNDKGLY
jgi:hypothetical protein